MAKEAKSQEEQKSIALETTVSQIEKKYGKGSVMKLGGAALTVESFPSGSLGLDLALGVGGIPKGRIVEIYGPEASGKTTLALQMIAEVQKKGGIAGFVDAEHALDPNYAKSIGVDVDELYISQPDCGEQALDIVEMMVRSGALDLVVIDSVAALTPEAEINGEMGDMQVGLQARLMSKALRKLTSVIGKTKCTVVFINQIREKVGVMFGPTETTSGGRALKFFSSVRIDVRKQDTIKQNGVPVGNRVKAKIVKNKVAPPFREVQFDIVFGKGISKSGELLDMGTERGVVQKNGSYYSYKGERIGQGRETAKAFLEANPAYMDEIEFEIRRIEAEKAERHEHTANSFTENSPAADTSEVPLADSAPAQTDGSEELPAN